MGKGNKKRLPRKQYYPFLTNIPDKPIKLSDGAKKTDFHWWISNRWSFPKQFGKKMLDDATFRTADLPGNSQNILRVVYTESFPP
jgi:hypothetical protein